MNTPQVLADTIFREIAQKSLILVSGKGGIGKTFVSSSLGMALAEMGKRVLVVESSSCAQVGPLFGAVSPTHETVSISKNLSSINLLPRECFREYVADHLGFSKLYEKVFDHAVVKSFLTTLPGLGEVMLLGRLMYSVELDERHPYDVVIFDGPASGHFLALMTTPDAVIASGLGGAIGERSPKNQRPSRQ